MRKDAVKQGQIPKYDNRCRSLSQDAMREKLGKNIPHVIRFKVEYFPQKLLLKLALIFFWLCIYCFHQLDAFPNGFDDLVFGTVAHDPFEIEGDPV